LTGGAGSPRELARLIRSSDESVETCIAHCDVAARDLLPYGDVVIAPSTDPADQRTLNGPEIDEALAAEHRRRADWHNASCLPQLSGGIRSRP
jgi:hypothetical protein